MHVYVYLYGYVGFFNRSLILMFGFKYLTIVFGFGFDQCLFFLCKLGCVLREVAFFGIFCDCIFNV
jgi:hypothetical protein